MFLKKRAWSTEPFVQKPPFGRSCGNFLLQEPGHNLAWTTLIREEWMTAKSLNAQLLQQLLVFSQPEQ
jgi:hypothetical protein